MGQGALNGAAQGAFGGGGQQQQPQMVSAVAAAAEHLLVVVVVVVVSAAAAAAAAAAGARVSISVSASTPRRAQTASRVPSARMQDSMGQGVRILTLDSKKRICR